ncbi:hypothetical protein [Chitinilyticum piscinae]|uniref:Uncharacterized protein n=1 Tax=Chitinilyticum piscinae TaxID=2866724 RepID=A0A8J7FJ62_9NEIS|nr:hypothetical protein [Chitinilyticum piscinae]MBE9607844.1 hypothetical protein [Chitinilyticum piscinae]
MSIDIQKIISTHEKTINGKKVLFVPKSHSDKLLVLLSAHNQKNNYFLLRTFLENQTDNLLFLTDTNNTWYLDNDKGKTYAEIISSYSNNFPEGNTCIFGSSMAGYAAIHFALKNNLHCLACNPQVSIELSLDYGWHELNKNMLRTINNGGAVNLQELAEQQSNHTGVIFIIHGHAPIDIANVELILEATPNHRKLITHTIDSDDHAMPFGRDIEKVNAALDLIFAFHKFNLPIGATQSNIKILKDNRHHNNRHGIKRYYKNWKGSDQQSFAWNRRHFLQNPGIYFCRDIGLYNSSGEKTGTPFIFDGSELWQLKSAMPCDKIHDFSADEVPYGPVSNNQAIGNAWFRAPDGECLLHSDGGGHFTAKFITGKNCYFNISLNHFLDSGFKNGHEISCMIDVEVERGSITLSLGAHGISGYYQANKIIESSGRHTLVFHADTVNNKHRDALFARIYFLSDGKSKSIKINSIAFAHGNLPTVEIFESTKND